ncbi:MAG: rod shape-determining protein RodA [Kiritimatiellae bacterium]|nr:rod shape-determining protein RodA [Kiritimatiellia bacterium]
MRKLFAKIRRMDWAMSACMVALIAIGVVFINSAGSVRPTETLRNLWRVHAETAAVGLFVYMAFALLDYRKLVDWAATPVFALSCAMLVAVLFVGTDRFGGRRWLWFFQPSEIAKLAVILFSAHVFAAPGRSGFRWFLAGMAILGGPALLVLAEPDLGTALVLAPSVLAILLAARVWTKGIATLVAAILLAAGALLWTVDRAERQTDPERREQIYRYVPLREHQIKRLRVFLFPDTDRSGAGYNLRQAQISIGSGGVWGTGLKKGAQKLLGYLPPSVSMNDFIFAVLAEEWGFMGVLEMLALFFGILASGLRIAARCMDDRGRLVAIGVLTLVFCHLYVNVAMSVGLVPITGLPLPFISAGRTFLVVLMAALGIVQSIAVHDDAEPSGEDGPEE